MATGLYWRHELCLSANEVCRDAKERALQRIARNISTPVDFLIIRFFYAPQIVYFIFLFTHAAHSITANLPGYSRASVWTAHW
jgi:hypothetical protein